ncbi:UTRA domain-containing protein [Actinoplanes sp. CA-252034]|uniref:UTRA domain-containing protein n=1 Tax=Actinoplanes sp. CA-252034 TaxID=3239906 RepID=UPI003D96FB1A
MIVVDTRFAGLLKALRQDSGLSLRSLATIVHYSHSYLWDIETGRKQPTPEVAHALDAALSAEGTLAELVTHQPDADMNAPLSEAMRLLDGNRHHLQNLAQQLRDADDDPAARHEAAQWARFAKWLNSTFVRSRPRLVRWGARRYSARLRSETGASPFRMEMMAQGRAPRTECRAVTKKIAPADIASLLMIEEGDFIICRENHYFADDEPVQIGMTFLPEYLATEAPHLGRKALGRGSLYSRLADIGYRAARVNEHIIARMPSMLEGEHLAISPITPVLEITHTSFNEQGQPFEVTRFVIRADLTTLDFEMPVED